MFTLPIIIIIIIIIIVIITTTTIILLKHLSSYRGQTVTLAYSLFPSQCVCPLQPTQGSAMYLFRPQQL
jgi:hypothetical protein